MKPIQDPASGPREAYEARHAARAAARDGLERVERRISDARLATAVALVALGVVAWRSPAVSAAWLLAPAAIFAALVVAHALALARLTRLRHAVAYYDLGLTRVDGRADPRAPTGEAFAPADHPFAVDLDLFGEGSLFARLCTCRTWVGEATLARWLLRPAAPEELSGRQEAVGELAAALDLREDLFALGHETRPRLHVEVIERWAGLPFDLPRVAAPVGVTLAVAALAAVAGWATGTWGALPLIGVAAAQGLATLWLRRRVAAVLEGMERPGRELRVLATLMRRVEREPFEGAALRALQAALRGGRRAASAEVGGLARLSELADHRHNQLFAPLAFLLSWAPLFAVAVERWRRRQGAAIGRWLQTLGELEALAAFGAYAFEHPDDAPAELTTEGARYEAAGLSHPLLPPSGAVRNDVRLGDATRLLVVSGSNMSGKSTLLRSVGVSVVMGLAGCPARARRLRLSPLVVGASLHTLDSLQAGRSRFYAEIERHKQVLDAASEDQVVLFLLDEILHGTNSHDRLIGTRALVNALLDRGAVGLITTHDLALTELTGGLDGRAENAHFVDQFVDGGLEFDYRLRPGVVTRSNAIELMRSIGLPV
jgi:hypothetical protein